MGGEKISFFLTGCSPRGSPPRGRGKGKSLPEFVDCDGITPAWAGKSRRYLQRGHSSKDHPRVGGEKFCPGLLVAECLGSPPRGRGKEEEDMTPDEFAGITPAWAGKSEPYAIPGVCKKDHPRVGGEKLLPRLAVAVKRGSPPRGRGKAGHGCHAVGCRGITPAWAGKSSWRMQKFGTSGDHPRVGGEKRCIPVLLLDHQGSPPRGRGKAESSLKATLSSRITPAWAGKRLFFTCSMFHSRDHPRVGGEKKK